MADAVNLTYLEVKIKFKNSGETSWPGLYHEERLDCLFEFRNFFMALKTAANMVEYITRIS